ncbi:MAG: hypothetical protein ABWW69_07870 [Pyrodictiaceae archaeon]
MVRGGLDPGSGALEVEFTGREQGVKQILELTEKVPGPLVVYGPKGCGRQPS